MITPLKPAIKRSANIRTGGMYFENFGQLVTEGKRDILDSFVPIQLSQAIVRLCDDLRFTISDTGNIRLAQKGNDQEHTISAVNIHDHFGGAVIEDVLEKGSYRIPASIMAEWAEQAVPPKSDRAGG